MEIGKTLSLDYISIIRRKSGSKTTSEMVSYTNEDRDVIPEIDFFKDSKRRLSTTQDGDERKYQVAFLKQMQAGLPEQLLALYFTDYESDTLKSGVYGYRIRTELKDKYYEFVENILSDLYEALSLISSLYESYTTERQFDTLSNSVKKDFLISYFRSFNITIDEQYGNIIHKTDTEDLLSESPMLRAIDYIEEAFDLLNIEFDSNNFLNKINPITATPESLYMAIKDMRLLINLVEKRYKIKSNKFKNTQGVGMGS